MFDEMNHFQNFQIFRSDHVDGHYFQIWGEQFHGGNFDLSTYWNSSSKVDINMMQFSVGEETVEVQFGEDFDVVDEEPIH